MRNFKRFISRATAFAMATTLFMGVPQEVFPKLSEILPNASVLLHAEDGVAINETNFPDYYFRKYVRRNFDKDNYGILSSSEISAVRSIDVYNEAISSLKGIEYFSALTELYCGGNSLTSLDVSKNTALTVLECYGNQLTSLDVSKNTALKTLECQNNQLTSLDVKNTALTYLECQNNQLTTLDVSKNTALTFLQCRYNQLTSLDVSKNTALTELYCGGNPLTSLDVSKNTALTALGCGFNQLTSLDVSKNTALKFLYCYHSQLTSLDVSKNTALIYLECDDNQLTSLDVTNNNALERLRCYNNQLTSLDVSKNTALKILDCYNNQLTSLDVSKNKKLTELKCNNNTYTINMGVSSEYKDVYKFDLSLLPKFDATKASDWTGATYNSNTNTLSDFTSNTVTYTYDCGNGESETFTLKLNFSDDTPSGSDPSDDPQGGNNNNTPDNYKDAGTNSSVTKNKVVLESVKMNGVDKNLIYDYHKYCLDYYFDPSLTPGVLTFTCETTDNSSVESFHLYKDDNIVASSTTNVIVVPACNLATGISGDKDAFIGSGYYIDVVYKEGYCAKTKLKFDVMRSKELNEWSLQLGGKDTGKVTIPNDIPFIGGGELSVDMVSYPVYINVEGDGTFQIGINVKDDVLDDENKRNIFKKSLDNCLNQSVKKSEKKYKSNKKYFDDLFEKNDLVKYMKDGRTKVGKVLNKVDPDGGFEFKVVGYGEGKYDPKGPNVFCTDVKLCISAKAKGEIGWQTVIVVVPVMVEVEASGELEGSFEVKLTYNSESEKLELLGEIVIDSSIEVSICSAIGLRKVAYVGPYGKGKISSELVLLSNERDPGFDNVTATLSGGLKVKVLFFTYKKVFAQETWLLYQREPKTLSQGVQYAVANLYNQSNYVLSRDISNEYIVDSYDAEYTSGAVISNANLAANPKLVKIGDKTMMIYLSRDSSRGFANDQLLKYTIYDPSTDSWSDPVQIDDNNTFDWDSYVYTFNDKIYVIYSQADKEFSNDATDDELREEVLHSMKITIAEYDSDTQSFINFTDLSADDNTYNSLPILSSIEGNLTAIWINNTSDDMFNQNSFNNIVYSTYSTDSWSQPETIAENVNCITSVSAGNLNDSGYVAVCFDTDNDLSTQEDGKVTLYDFAGVSKDISSGIVDGVQFENLPTDNSNALIWYENNNIAYISSKDAVPENLFGDDEEMSISSSNFIIEGNSIFYVGAFSEDSSAIYQATYKNDAWNSVISAAEGDGSIPYLSSTDSMVVYVDTKGDITSENLTDITSIKSFIFDELFDIVAVSADFTPEQVEPGKTIPVSIEIMNNGNEILNNVTVTFKNADNTVLSVENVECNIEAGNCANITANFTIPETIDDSVFTVMVTGEKQDRDISDNSADFNFGKTELSVKTSERIVNNVCYFIAEIENESYIDAKNVLLTLSDPEGNVIFSKEYSSVPSKTTAKAIVNVDELCDDSSEKIIVAEISAENEEYYTHNNKTQEYAVVMDGKIPYVIVVFKDINGYEISRDVYDIGATITPPELNANESWTLLGGNPEIAITDFSDIREDKVFVATHIHNLSNVWNKDSTGHWHNCSGCDEKVDFSEHIENAGTVTTEPTEESVGEKTYSCVVCEYVIRTEEIEKLPHTHKLSTDWSSDKTGHWHNCNGCDEKVDFSEHTEDEGTVTTGPTEESVGEKTYSCVVCGYVIRTEEIEKLPHTHKLSTDWSSDKTGHWHNCSGCDEKVDFSEHTEDEGKITTPPTYESEGVKTISCKECGYVIRTETIDKLVASVYVNDGATEKGFDNLSNALTAYKTSTADLTITLGEEQTVNTLILPTKASSVTFHGSPLNLDMTTLTIPTNVSFGCDINGVADKPLNIKVSGANKTLTVSGKTSNIGTITGLATSRLNVFEDIEVSGIKTFADVSVDSGEKTLTVNGNITGVAVASGNIRLVNETGTATATIINANGKIELVDNADGKLTKLTLTDVPSQLVVNVVDEDGNVKGITAGRTLLYTASKDFTWNLDTNNKTENDEKLGLFISGKEIKADIPGSVKVTNLSKGTTREFPSFTLAINSMVYPDDYKIILGEDITLSTLSLPTKANSITFATENGSSLKFSGTTLNIPTNVSFECDLIGTNAKPLAVRVSANKTLTIAGETTNLGAVSGTATSILNVNENATLPSVMTFKEVKVENGNTLTVTGNVSSVTTLNGSLKLPNPASTVAITNVDLAEMMLTQINGKFAKVTISDIEDTLRFTVIDEEDLVVDLADGTVILNAGSTKDFTGKVQIMNSNASGQTLNAFLYGRQIKAEYAGAITLSDGTTTRAYPNLDLAFSAMNEANDYTLTLNCDVATTKTTLPTKPTSITINGVGAFMVNATSFTIPVNTTIETDLIGTNARPLAVKVSAKKTLTIAGETTNLGAVSGTATSILNVNENTTFPSVMTFKEVNVADTKVLAVSGNVSGVNELDGTLELLNSNSKATAVIKNVDSAEIMLCEVNGLLPKLTVTDVITALDVEVVNASGKLPSGKTVMWAGGVIDFTDKVTVVNKTPTEKDLNPFVYGKEIKAEYPDAITVTVDEVDTNVPNFTKAFALVTDSTKDYTITLNESFTETKFVIPSKANSITFTTENNSVLNLNMTSLNVPTNVSFECDLIGTNAKPLAVKVSANKTLTIAGETTNLGAVSGTATSILNVNENATFPSVMTFKEVNVADTKVLAVSGNVSGVNELDGTLELLNSNSKATAVIKNVDSAEIMLCEVNGLLPKLTVTDVITALNVEVVNASGKLPSGKTVMWAGGVIDFTDKVTVVNKTPTEKDLSPFVYGKEIKAEYPDAITVTVDEVDTNVPNFTKAFALVTDSTKDYTITLNESLTETKFVIPSKANSLTLKGKTGNETLSLTNLTAITFPVKTTVEDLRIESTKAFTLTASKGLSVQNFKSDTITTIRGTATGTLTLGKTEFAIAPSITAFGTIDVTDEFTAGKSLTTTNLNIKENAGIVVPDGATTVSAKTLKGEENSYIKLLDGFKPITITGTTADSVSGTIKLVGDTIADNAVVFTTRTVGDNVFDLTAVRDNAELDYELAIISGKAYMKPIALVLETTDGTEVGKYALWNDMVTEINAIADADAEYNVKLLGDYNIGGALKLPTAKKYKTLNIIGTAETSDLYFTGTSLALTGNLGLEKINLVSKTATGTTVKYTIATGTVTNGYTLCVNNSVLDTATISGGGTVEINSSDVTLVNTTAEVTLNNSEVSGKLTAGTLSLSGENTVRGLITASKGIVADNDTTLNVLYIRTGMITVNANGISGSGKITLRITNADGTSYALLGTETISAKFMGDSFEQLVLSDENGEFIVTKVGRKLMLEELVSEEGNAPETEFEEIPTEDDEVTDNDEPTEDTPTEDTPTEDEPTEDTPTDDTPIDDEPTEDTSTEDTPIDDIPTEDTPIDDIPTDDTPAENVTEELVA